MTAHDSGLDINEHSTVQIIEVIIQRGMSGLYYATSYDLYGLLIAKPTKEEAIDAVAPGIHELLTIRGERDIAVLRATKCQTAGRVWAVVKKSPSAVEADIARRHAEQLASKLLEIINLAGQYDRRQHAVSINVPLDLIDLARVVHREYTESTIAQVAKAGAQGA